jgi:hypothetical protein
MMQQLHEPPPAPSAVRPGLPRALDSAVARAMAKKPAERFSSAASFAGALDAIEPERAVVEPISTVAASVVAKAPRDWRVYAIGACLVTAASLGLSTVRDRGSRAPQNAAVADTTTTAVAMGQPAQATPTAVVPAVGTEVNRSTTVPVPTVTFRPERATVPTPNVTPGSSPARPPQRTPSRVVPADSSSEKPPINATPTRTVATAAPVPARERDETASASAVARRAQDLLQRCVAAIGNNDGGSAGRLLSGQTAGLLTAVNDGRIASASLGGIDVDPGDDRVTAHGSVQIAWRTAFGGNKSAAASITATLTRSGDGWRAGGCSVGRDGGVR